MSRGGGAAPHIHIKLYVYVNVDFRDNDNFLFNEHLCFAYIGEYYGDGRTKLIPSGIIHKNKKG